MRKLKIYEMQRLSVDAFRSAQKLPIVLVLDSIRSMNNVGSILRTADAFRLQKVYLCGITAQPPHPDIHKTALGAEGSVDWQYVAEANDVLQELKDKGYHICALEQTEHSTMLQDFQPSSTASYALFLGNEVDGLQQSLVDRADTYLEIPQYGTKHSLNVAVATGIAVWQMASPLLSGLASQGSGERKKLRSKASSLQIGD